MGYGVYRLHLVHRHALKSKFIHHTYRITCSPRWTNRGLVLGIRSKLISIVVEHRDTPALSTIPSFICLSLQVPPDEMHVHSTRIIRSSHEGLIPEPSTKPQKTLKSSKPPSVEIELVASRQTARADHARCTCLRVSLSDIFSLLRHLLVLQPFQRKDIPNDTYSQSIR
jgi:hypothetical protein